MPNPTINSTSVLTKPPESELDTANAKVQQVDDIHDWFHGTEELLDALPKAWTRSLLYLLVGFAVVVVPWSMLAKVDETGTARGRIEPKGATQRLDAAVAGTVVGVRAKEGDRITKGQLLLELESDVLRTDLNQAQTRLEGQQNRLSQLELLKNQVLLSIGVQEQQNQAQALEKLAQVNQAKQNLDARQSTHNLQKVEKLALVDQAKQNITATQTAQNLAASRLSRDATEVQRFHQLWQQGVIPEVRVVELQKSAEESRKMHEQAKSDLKQAHLRLKEEQSRYQTVINQSKSDITQAKLRLEEQNSSYQGVVNAGKLAVLRSQEQIKDLQTQISTLQSEIRETQSQIKSLNLQLAQRVVKAPVDGILFQFPIKRPGSVVQTGQMVAQIAPKDTAFILKSQMSSQESGFLRVGMPVKIKFDAYPFQDYGIVSGRVNWISPDSKIQETNQSRVEIFELEIALDQPYIQSGNKRIPLTPGQTATAEVIVRQRRIIDFILDPFKKLQKGGLDL